MKAERFDLCDDFGVWVVSPRPYGNGRWLTQEDAQKEADRRNLEHGVAWPNGELKEKADPRDDERFQLFHLKHPECTCAKETKATVSNRLEEGETSQLEARISNKIARSVSRHNR